MKRMIILLVAVGLICGCASIPKDGNALVGYYAMIRGGFNESLSIGLAQDGSYVLDHELLACVIGPNGEMPITYSKEEGTWKFEGGMVMLEPKARTKDFPDTPVFAPALARRLVPRRDGFSRVLVNADYPEQFVLRKAQKPSHLFEPAS